MKTWFALIAAIAATPAVAATQENSAAMQMPSREILRQMCSADGAMQYTFGQTGVPNSSRIESDLGRGFALPASMLPFTKALPRATEWSGKLMEMTYSFQTSDDGAALDLIETLAANAASEENWELVAAPDDVPMYLIGYGGEFTYARPVSGGVDGADSRVLWSLDYGYGEVTLTCGRDDLLLQHAREAFGDLPEGTPRPEVPNISVPLVRTEAECETPEMTEQMTAMLSTAESSDFMAAMLGRTKYRDRLTTWMLWKLEQSGKISSDELVELSFASVGDVSPDNNPFAAFAMIEEMLPIIENIAEAEETKNPAKLCRSLIPFESWITRVDALTFKQTAAAQSALSQKAAELRVSLE